MVKARLGNNLGNNLGDNLMPTKLFNESSDKPARKPRAAKNTGMTTSISEQILQSTLPIEERQRMLEGLLKDVTFYMGKEITPRIIENIMLTALLPMLHDEIAMAMSGSAEARRYLLDKMIPKAERSVVAPPLNIKIYLDQGKSIGKTTDKTVERMETVVGEIPELSQELNLENNVIEASFTNLEVKSETKEAQYETKTESQEDNN